MRDYASASPVTWRANDSSSFVGTTNRATAAAPGGIVRALLECAALRSADVQTEKPVTLECAGTQRRAVLGDFGRVDQGVEAAQLRQISADVVPYAVGPHV